MKYHFMSLAHFLIGLLLLVLLLGFGSSLYLIDTRSLLNMWFANIFSQLVACHSLKMSFEEQKFSIISKKSLSIFFMFMLFMLRLRTVCLPSNCEDFIQLFP